MSLDYFCDPRYSGPNILAYFGNSKLAKKFNIVYVAIIAYDVGSAIPKTQSWGLQFILKIIHDCIYQFTRIIYRTTEAGIPVPPKQIELPMMYYILF